MTESERKSIERKITMAAASAIVAAGYEVEVWRNDQSIQPQTSNIDAIIGAISGQGDERFYVYRKGATGEYFHHGFVRFTYGSRCWNVIKEHTAGLNGQLKHAHDLAMEFEHKYAASVILQGVNQQS